jgi:hypothetical protein
MEIFGNDFYADSFFKLFEYIFWDAKKFPKVRDRFPISDIYKCQILESGRGLLKIAKNETIKKVMLWCFSKVFKICEHNF